MYDIHSVEYRLFIFSKIIDAINEKLDNPAKYYLKPYASSRVMKYSDLINMNDQEIKDFLEIFINVNGFLNSTSIKGIEYKKIISGRIFLSFEFELQFDSDEEKLQYFNFRNHIIGLTA